MIPTRDVAPAAILMGLDSAALESSDNEYDKQHQKEALGDLAECVDEQQRSQRALGPDRVEPCPDSASDDVAGHGVGGDRPCVGSYERCCDRYSEKRG